MGPSRSESSASKPTTTRLTWEMVEQLRAAGSYGTADIAERILRERDRKAQRWHRRFGRWLRGL